MNYLALGILCVFAIELFFHLPVLDPIRGLINVSQKTVKVLSSSRISDHWKEKVLLRYSRDMALASIKIGLGLTFVLILVSAGALSIDLVLPGEVTTLEYAVTGEGLLLATLISIAYLFLRKRIVSA